MSRKKLEPEFVVYTPIGTVRHKGPPLAPRIVKVDDTIRVEFPCEFTANTLSTAAGRRAIEQVLLDALHRRLTEFIDSLVLS